MSKCTVLSSVHVTINKNHIFIRETWRVRATFWDKFTSELSYSSISLKTGRFVFVRSLSVLERTWSFNADFCWHIYASPQKYLSWTLYWTYSIRIQAPSKISEASKAYPFPKYRIKFITFETRETFHFIAPRIFCRYIFSRISIGPF